MLIANGVKKVVKCCVKNDVKKGVDSVVTHLNASPRWFTLFSRPFFTGFFTLLFTFKGGSRP
jgi:hypothetical protein